MTEQGNCPQCARPLPSDTPQGLCPACLLKRGLESNTIGASVGGGHASWTPPMAAELSASFPDLDIIALIGRGGMGAVYKARQKKLDRLVALKILPPEIGRDAGFAQRFAEEAQAMARLSHPNIVTIHDFGSRATPKRSETELGGAANTPNQTAVGGGTENLLYFFVMEYVDGLSLRQLLDRGTAGGEHSRTISPKEALAIVPQICDALQYAHDRGIVHRDIKPENILLNRSGQVKIADFGLAKLVGSGMAVPAMRGTGVPLVEEDTTHGQDAHATEKVMGTPQYMAPEQIDRPGAVDHRADIYSLGVVFYQMLTGELPKGNFEPPSRKVLIDVRLDEVVLRALEKQPHRRYQQVSQVKTEVETIMASVAGSLPAGVPPARVDATETSSAEPPTGPTTFATTSRMSRLAVAGAIWAAFAFIVLLTFSGRSTAVPAGQYHGPQWWQILLLILVGGLGITAPFGTTICGAVAISRIRHSAGRLYGLGLALFDALFFPLLVLDGLIGIGVVSLWSIFEKHSFGSLGDAMSAVVYGVFYQTLITAVISIIADFLIVLWAWRAAKRPVGSSAVAPAPPVAGPAPDLPQVAKVRQVVKAPAIGLIVAMCVNVAVMVFWVTISFVAYSFGNRWSLPLTPILPVLVAILICGIILWAAKCMERIKRYGLVLVVGIAVTMSLPGTLVALWLTHGFGIPWRLSWRQDELVPWLVMAMQYLICLPMGIWTLVVLGRREVIEAFATVRAGKAASNSWRAKLSPDKIVGSVLLTLAWHGILLLAFLAFVAFVVPRFLVLLKDLPAALPPITVATCSFARIIQRLWFLLFPVLLGIDAGVCFLLQYLAGTRARRLWSFGVTATMVFVALSMSVALLIPLATTVQSLTKHPASLPVVRQSSPPTPNGAAPQPAASPWRVTLPSGVTVELLGVSENPSQGKLWWGADGSPLTKAPYARSPTREIPGTGQKVREIAVGLGNLPADKVGVNFKSPFGSTSWSPATTDDGKLVRDLHRVVVAVPNDQSAVSLTVGVAAGPWTTVLEAGQEGHSGVTASRFGARFADSYEKEGCAAIPVAHNVPADMEVRIVAVDAQGQIHVGTSSGSRTDTLGQLTGKFDLPLKDVKEFQFQTRPFQWAQFKNVSLRPGSPLAASAGQTAAKLVHHDWYQAAHQRANSFLAALRQGMPALAYSDTTQEYRQGHAGGLERFAENMDLSKAKPVQVYVAMEAACVVISPVMPKGRAASISIGLGLIRVGKDYRIRDIDMLPNDEAVKRFVDGFFSAYPAGGSQPSAAERAAIKAALLRQEAELKLALAEARRKFGPKHRQTEAIQAKLEDVQKLIAETEGPATHAGATQPAAMPSSRPKATTDQIIVEDLALEMLVAIREKDDVALKSLSVDRTKGWRDALPHFSMELRERFRQMTGKPFTMYPAESIIRGDLAAVKCTGPKELNGTYLVLFFVKTGSGWKNFSLRNSPLSRSLKANLRKAAEGISVQLPASRPAD